MKHLFFLVDCSGSIVADDYSIIGQINDLLRDLISNCKSKGANDIRVICYANGAKVYWDSQKEQEYYDISAERFGGRSNLGKAYILSKNIIEQEQLVASDCCIVLISDGEATDNYRKSLNYLDPHNEIFRVAISVGISNHTTEKHANVEDNIFKKGIVEREYFIEKVIDFI